MARCAGLWLRCVEPDQAKGRNGCAKACRPPHEERDMKGELRDGSPHDARKHEGCKHEAGRARVRFGCVVGRVGQRAQCARQHAIRDRRNRIADTAHHLAGRCNHGKCCQVQIRTCHQNADAQGTKSFARLAQRQGAAEPKTPRQAFGNRGRKAGCQTIGCHKQTHQDQRQFDEGQCHKRDVKPKPGNKPVEVEKLARPFVAENGGRCVCGVLSCRHGWLSTCP
mmetsp:Transcript_29505/g.57912  ORF Transcript_29505/g.57912 Transcript_29505/m.57912 type:complete len:224 (+) Transcript_29505:1434-2105(+)